jgi:purine-binding chemotaxis protein CheW
MDERLTHFVSFRLGRQQYAFPLANVERALRMVAVTPVPQAPPWVAGVLNLHGQVVPVVDLRQQLGHPVREFQPDDRLLVVSAWDRTMVLVVDQVGQVLTMPAAQVTSSAEPLSRSRPLSAVIREGEDLILVLDAARLLPADAADWQPPGELPVEYREDDLTAIKGIGQVYASRLRAAGLCTYRALAGQSAEKIAALLGQPRSSAGRIQSWIDQAAELVRTTESET